MDEHNALWHSGYDTDPSVIYLLDANLRIARCNPAWDRFALANDGAEAIASRVHGKFILDVVPGVLQEFYQTAYHTVQKFQREWWHVFACSSPTAARDFHMRILPCPDGSLLTVNTLLHEEPYRDEPRGRLEQYADSDGIAKMCSHCRRVRSLEPPHSWDWIPELLIGSKVLITHGLCPFCLAYHYHRSLPDE